MGYAYLDRDGYFYVTHDRDKAFQLNKGGVSAFPYDYGGGYPKVKTDAGMQTLVIKVTKRKLKELNGFDIPLNIETIVKSLI